MMPSRQISVASEPSRREIIDAALGRRAASMVICGGRVVHVHSGEILTGDVAVLGNRIVSVGSIPDGCVGPGTQVVDATGACVIPGFIEPHFHAADPSMAPGDLARALLERGTTTLATDLVEFYAVGGVAAVRWALDELERSGLRTLFLLPLHALGMEAFGTLRHVPQVDEFLEMATWEQMAGINEPPPNTVLDGDGRVLEVLDATLGGLRVFEGHAPELTGARLQAYLAAGASSDHEATTADDALDKLRLGCHVIMRECSAARDLGQIAPLIARMPQASRFFMVCSDDMQCKELVDDGHIDHKLRVAIDAGVEPVTAVQLATINAAQYFGLGSSIGSVAPGRVADLLVVESLTDLRPRTVIAGGAVVARDGSAVSSREAMQAPPASLRPGVDIGRLPTPADLRVPVSDDRRAARVRVIGIENGTLLSRALEHTCPVRAGGVALDLAADVLKVAAFDRHAASGRVGLAFVRGTGLRTGAIASTFSWPHYGLVVIGTSDAEIVHAVEVMQRLGGGVVAVEAGELLASVEFDVGSIVGSRPLAEMHAELAAFEAAAARLGCGLTDPVTALAALTIPHIPRYGLSDRGLFDSEAAEFVDVLLD
jgi:adenine deaminase